MEQITTKPRYKLSSVFSSREYIHPRVSNEDGFRGFLSEEGRSSSGFTIIVRNHFTSPVVKGFEQFYRGKIASLFVCASARWSLVCADIYELDRIFHEFIISFDWSVDLFRFHCCEAMDIGCIKYIYQGLTLTPCGEFW